MLPVTLPSRRSDRPRRRAVLLSAAAAALLVVVPQTGFIGIFGPEGNDERPPPPKGVADQRDGITGVLGKYRVKESDGDDGLGLAYRASKTSNDFAEGGARWGEIVEGIDEGDGWLRVPPGERFLPIRADGQQMISIVDEKDLPKVDKNKEEDWRDTAFAKQQQKLAARRAQADPNRKMTAQEILLRQRKKAVWRAMSTRSSESVLSTGEIQDGREIKVQLSKPLGINFLEINPNDPCGALIGEIAEGGSAAESGRLNIGDVLVEVDGERVQGMPLEEAIQPLMAKEGEFTLTFFRID